MNIDEDDKMKRADSSEPNIDLGIWVSRESENYWEKNQKFHLVRYWNGFNDNWVKVFDQSGRLLTDVVWSLVYFYFVPLEVCRERLIEKVIET